LARSGRGSASRRRCGTAECGDGVGQYLSPWVGVDGRKQILPEEMPMLSCRVAPTGESPMPHDEMPPAPRKPTVSERAIAAIGMKVDMTSPVTTVDDTIPDGSDTPLAITKEGSHATSRSNASLVGVYDCGAGPRYCCW
jgi:hypothetical protein